MYVKNDYINFSWMVIENMLSTRKILGKDKYEESSRHMREGIFEHFKVSFEGYSKESVKSPWIMSNRPLKIMKIYKTKNQGYVFWPYLRDEDEMANPKDPNPSRDRQIFQRIIVSEEGNVAQPISPMVIGKRPKESTRAGLRVLWLLRNLGSLKKK